jgi:hypothetical protein
MKCVFKFGLFKIQASSLRMLFESIWVTRQARLNMSTFYPFKVDVTIKIIIKLKSNSGLSQN